MAAAAKPQKMPFRYGTVKRRIPLGTYPVTPGGSIPTITIPQVGMMSRIVCNVTGTYTAAAAAALNLLDGYDAIISRARIGLNNGSANVVDLSGIGINQVNRRLSANALPIKRGLLVTTAAQAFQYMFILPVNANQRRQFEMGLINLQAPELRATLDLTFAALTNVFADVTKVTLFAATVEVAYEYYEIPDLNRYQLPPLTLVRTIEEAAQTIVAVGDQIYQIPRLGTMVDYSIVLVQANTYATVLSKLAQWRLRYNKSDVQYDMSIAALEVYEAEAFGIGGGDTPPVQNGTQFTSNANGAFMNQSALTFSLWGAGDRAWEGGDFRDAIDTEENTTTESITTVAPGFAIDTTKTNALYHVRRVVQRIIQAPAPA